MLVHDIKGDYNTPIYKVPGFIKRAQNYLKQFSTLVSNYLINYRLVRKLSIINMFEVVLKNKYLVFQTVQFIEKDNRNPEIRGYYLPSQLAHCTKRFVK